MAVKQFYPTQKFKAIFLFNGGIDGEPVVVAQGGFTGQSAQDPKIEQPSDPNDPNSPKETRVTSHIYCTQPNSIVAGGGGTYENHPEYNGRYMISLPCTATVDDPATANDTEKIHEPFEFVAEWIPAAQAKATTISMPALEVEP
jgi:hypothetical protein